VASTTTNRSLTQYSGDTPSDLFIRDVPDWMRMLRRQDTPFTKLISTTSAPDVPMLKAEFGWGSPDPVQDTLAAAINSTGATTITVTNVGYWSVGRVAEIDSEQLRVESVNTGTSAVGVTRGFAGTTAATHTNGSTVYFYGVALKELEDDPESPITQGEVDFNYHMIMSFSWVLSNRANITPTYETRNFSGDRDAQELRKKMEYTAPLAMERQFLYGQRALGSTSGASAMGGLAQTSFVTTRTSIGGTTTPLTEYDFMNGLQTVWQLVGSDMMPDTAMLDAFGKRIVNSWYNSSRRTSGGDSKISVKWDEIETDFGTIKFVTNWQLKDRAQIHVFRPEDIKRRAYASSTGWQKGKLVTQGWYTHSFLRGDFTLIPQNPDSRLLLYNYSITNTDYPGLA
jgi:hypothetical protein